MKLLNPQENKLNRNVLHSWTEILEDTLTKISPEIFADIDTGEIDAEELIKKEVSFISTKDIVDMIQRKSVFIY